jgi:hypothetical protein
MKLLNKVTFDQVKNSNSDTVYYSTRTFWWTDDPNDLRKTEPLPKQFHPPGVPADYGAGLPCDIFGGVLYQMEKSKWVGDEERIKAHYGSIEVLMAMHHKNFTPDVGDPIKIFATKQTFIDAVAAAGS